jgi:hypothetical protein
MPLKRIVLTKSTAEIPSEKLYSAAAAFLNPGDEFCVWTCQAARATPKVELAKLLTAALEDLVDFALWVDPRLLKPGLLGQAKLSQLWRTLDFKHALFLSQDGLVCDQFLGLDFRVTPTLQFLVDLRKSPDAPDLAALLTDLVKKHQLNVEPAGHWLALSEIQESKTSPAGP